MAEEYTTLTDMYNASESDMIAVVREAKSMLMMLRSDVRCNEEVYHLPLKYSGTDVETALNREMESCDVAIYRLKKIERSSSVSKVISKYLSLF